MSRWLPLVLLLLLAACGDAPESTDPVPAVVRVATYNIEDVYTRDLMRADHPRLRAAAATIQELRPDILLVNEFAYDQPGAPDYDAAAGPGQNARRFAEVYLSVSQGEGLDPIRYTAYMAPVNTGLSSGFDLDNSGAAVTAFPEPGPPADDGTPPPQSPEGRAYGNDAWGFGTFPGQYGMALFVREDFDLLADSVRTFQTFRWVDMPGALLPEDPETGAPWFDEDEAEAVRLSSKSHWDVPVRLPDGPVLHVLASHPTPPAFDGPEQRNKRRNHDEIRLWADYLSGADYLVDDAGQAGGLDSDAPFVIVGDLNADPDEGSTYGNPIDSLLYAHPRVQAHRPTADSAGVAAFPDLDPDDTARWGLGVDYVLPSANVEVLRSGVWRPTAEADTVVVSDHFPVWVDLAVPRE